MTYREQLKKLIAREPALRALFTVDCRECGGPLWLGEEDPRRDETAPLCIDCLEAQWARERESRQQRWGEANR